MLALTGLAGLALAGCGGGVEGNAGTVRFTRRLRIPPVLDPRPGADGVKRFRLRLRPGQTELLPGKTARTWGINGDYLGPTLRARRGDRVAMTVLNTLTEASTLHWHGMRLPAVMDGGPHQMVEPGAVWEPHWTIDQPAATTWYHPHPHGRTSQHVYRGLAGLFLLDDDTTAALPHTYGKDDVPLIVQDKKFTRDGQLDEDFAGTFGLLGNDILVNGTYGPYFPVTSTRVRFRVLNGSNAHVYNLGFDDNRTFHVVASDGGLLDRPAATRRCRISPGERFEIVAEFAPGETAMLTSRAGDSDIESGDYDLLKLVAATTLTRSPALPATLVGPARVTVGATSRSFRLFGAKINGRPMDMYRIDEVIPAGARETWRLDNVTYEHSFHIHEVSFRILDLDGHQPPEYLRGPKDTVFVPGKTTARLAVAFGGYVDPTAPYMYHCHILRHEDRGMMGQFVIVRPGTEGTTPRRLPVPDHDTSDHDVHGHDHG